LPLVSALNSEARANLGQFVYIINQDISLGGEKILLEVFKPFEKTNEVRNDGDGNIRGGAGLGLTLVKNIIELHHGNVELFSEIGKGTEVRITLPQ
jgi:signal transduction histidine kinase